MHILELDKITKRFGSTTVLEHVTLNVSQGETVSIIGSSGAGKSTLLRCVNQLELIDSGRISLEGEELVTTDEKGSVNYLPEKELRRIRSKTAMVFQHFNLFPHLTCLENITLTGIKIRKENKSETEAFAHSLLKIVGLPHKADAYPSQLSGGQKQRIAIARALALKPKVMLFDEPTSALDPEITGEVLTVIRKLAEEKMTMLVVTHEIPFARDVSDSVVYMDKGQIVEVGKPTEIFTNPKTERLNTFLSSILRI